MALDRYVVANYAEDLSKVVKKALMLCEVAALARECQPKKSFGVYNKVQRAPPVTQFGISREEFDGIVRSNAQHDDDDYADGETLPNDTSYDGGFIIDPVSDPRRSTLDQSQKMKINDLLGAWYVCSSSLKMPTLLALCLNVLTCFMIISGKIQKMKWVQRYVSSANE